MSYAAALSTALDTSRALEEVCTQALKQLQGQPDLALVFFSPHHAGAAGGIWREAAPHFRPRAVALVELRPGQPVRHLQHEVREVRALGLQRGTR